MAFETISGGLTLVIPTNGQTNWGTTVRNSAWVPISNHKHQGGGDGGQIPTGGLADNSVTTAKLSKNYGYTQATTVSASGTAATIDLSLGNVQTLDVSGASGDVTVTINNPASGSIYWIYIVQGATPRNVIWPAAAKFPQGVAPILSTANGSIDVVRFYYNGTHFRSDLWELDVR